MAFATVVSLANIGSFLLQTASFGQVIVTNTTRVQQLLRSAQRELEEAGKELVKFYHIIDTGEEVAVDDLFDKHTAYVTPTVLFQIHLISLTSQAFRFHRATT